MADINYDQMPFRCFPASWEPEIRGLLVSIADRLTPAQRAAFRLTDVKEKHGELRVYWGFNDGCEPLDPDIDAEIEALIETTSRNVAVEVKSP